MAIYTLKKKKKRGGGEKSAEQLKSIIWHIKTVMSLKYEYST